MQLNKKGLTGAEYALMLGIVSLVIVNGFTLIVDEHDEVFLKLVNKLQTFDISTPEGGGGSAPAVVAPSWGYVLSEDYFAALQADGIMAPNATSYQAGDPDHFQFPVYTGMPGVDATTSGLTVAPSTEYDCSWHAHGLCNIAIGNFYDVNNGLYFDNNSQNVLLTNSNGGSSTDQAGYVHVSLSLANNAGIIAFDSWSYTKSSIIEIDAGGRGSGNRVPVMGSAVNELILGNGYFEVADEATFDLFPVSGRGAANNFGEYYYHPTAGGTVYAFKETGTTEKHVMSVDDGWTPVSCTFVVEDAFSWDKIVMESGASTFTLYKQGSTFQDGDGTCDAYLNNSAFFRL